MVGFGSSLRMSRRRGWEDAYLDYASLRLLLTQIEAVYEEEDWKRGGSSNTLDEGDEMGWLNRSEDEEDEERGVLGSLKFWRMLRRPLRRRRRQHRSRQVQVQSWDEAIEDDEHIHTNMNSNWVVSSVTNRSSPRRSKKDKASHALDKRGWRSPGVTDYRDELFLVSDDDIAFGCCADHEDDSDDWEDTDEDCEEEVYEDCDHVGGDSNSSDYDDTNNQGNNRQDCHPLQTLIEEQRSLSGASFNPNEIKLEEEEEEEEAVRQTNNDSPAATLDELQEGLDTMKSDQFETPTDNNNVCVLESRYETFASVAAKRGGANTTIRSASPEQPGWLDFIPGFLGKRTNSNPKEQASKGEETNKTSPALGFAETLSTAKTSPGLAIAEYLSPSKGNHLSPGNNGSTKLNLKFRYDNHKSSLFVDPESSEPTTPNSLYSSWFNYKPATATALGSSMPTTPISLSPVVEKSTIPGSGKPSTDGSGFGISLNSSLLPSSETTGLLTSSSSFKTYYGQQNKQQTTPTRDNRRTGSGVSQYQFYSFQDNNEQPYGQNEADGNVGTGNDMKRNQNSNMFSYYNDGYFSVRSHQQRKSEDMAHLRLPPLPVRRTTSESSGNFIMNFLLGRTEQATGAQGNVHVRKDSSRKRRANIKRKRERLRRRKQMEQRRNLVPENLRVAHVRASAITVRFRGLLRAEVEKIILFANSRLGELSDTIGSLRYLSYEEGSQNVRRTFPNLDDGGIHPYSSSDDEEREDISCASSDEDNPHTHFDQSDGGQKRHYRYESDSSNEKGATKRQLLVRDRLRISRPLFQKAGFLGEDFSLLSAVDEADAYIAIGVELLHLLKFVCVNIIAVRKICKKHDRLLSNRMLGDYYHQQINRLLNANSGPKTKHSDHTQTPQFGLLLSKPAGLETTGGYTLGTFDTQIQEIANSTTMQTVSSSLAVALAEFEASQSRSCQLRLDREELEISSDSKPTLDEAPAPAEIPSPKHSPFTTKRLRDAVSYQIGGHCFRADDESSAGTPEKNEEDEQARDISLTRLQYVVTSVFGLREAARNRSTSFQNFASRLFMASIGPNITGDGLTGCARETLDFFCSYNPDKAYLLGADSLYSSMRSGREKAMGLVMTSTLEASASREASSLAIRRDASGNQEGFSSSSNSGIRPILRLNTVSMLLFTCNYYSIMPSAYMFALELDTRSSQSLLSVVANFSSLIACFVHAIMLSKRHSLVKRPIIDPTFFRYPLIASAVFAIFGNILYSYSLPKKSFKLALLGRFLFGFGSCELFNRHIISVALTNDALNGEIAVLVKRSLIAPATGLFLGSLFDLRVKDDGVHFLDPPHSHRGIIHRELSIIQHSSIAYQTHHAMRSLESPSYNVSSTFPNSSVAAAPSLTTKNTSSFANETIQPFALPPTPILPPSNSSFNALNSSVPSHIHAAINYSTTISEDVFLPPLPLPSNSLQVRLPFGEHRLISLNYVGYIMAGLWCLQLMGLLFFFNAPKRSILEKTVQPHLNQTQEEEDLDTFDDSDENVFVADDPANDEVLDGTFKKLQTMSRRSVNYGSKHTFVQSITNAWRLVLSNVAFPTTAAILVLSKSTTEVFLCSGGTIMSRYFAWSGALAGLFMGAVATLVLPINVFLSEEKNLVERKIIKGALKTAKYGIIIIINYEAIFFFLTSITKNEKKWVMPAIYDDVFGILQYIVGFCLIFVSMSFLESTTLSLMSKVSPLHLKRYSIDNSFIVIVLSAIGRLVGDLLVSLVDVSSWMFCSDIINSMLIPLMIGFIAGEYLVRKHYFFLI